jgi:hypothetical protein
VGEVTRSDYVGGIDVKKLIHLDDLTQRCGYFAVTKNRDGSWKNNGYGCTHRGNKESPGACYSCSCPVACNADYENLRELDPELAKEYEEEQKEHGFIESQWMIVYRKYYLKKIFGMEG